MLLRPSGDLAETQILIQQVWAGGLTLWLPAGSWQRWCRALKHAESACLYLLSAAPAHPRSWYRKQVHHEIDEGGKGRRAQPLKERHSPWRLDEGWLEPARSKTAEGPTSSSPCRSLYAQGNTPAVKDTPTSARTLLTVTVKGQKVGGGPVPGNLHSFPRNNWDNLPTR